MVAHLTSRPAKRIGVYPYRGLVAVGSAADLVLLDPETIVDRATYEQPKLLAEGIRFVLVNGEIAMDEGMLTGMRAGRALRRRKDGNVAANGE
jgi:N-acyl-D-aspartate/D-glutamate deacylase